MSEHLEAGNLAPVLLRAVSGVPGYHVIEPPGRFSPSAEHFERGVSKMDTFYTCET